MSLLKRENGDSKLNKICIDLHSELGELCSETQKKLTRRRDDFKEKLTHTIHEIDQIDLIHLKDIEEVNKSKGSEIDQLQILVNELIRELEIFDAKTKKN